MSTALCPFCGHPLTYLNHTTCTPEAESELESDHGDPGPDVPEQETATLTHCAEHGVTLPCGAHAGDHVAGLHTTRVHAECPRCVTPPAQIDTAALAAGDDSLSE